MSTSHLAIDFKFEDGQGDRRWWKIVSVHEKQLKTWWFLCCMHLWSEEYLSKVDLHLDATSCAETLQCSMYINAPPF